MRKPFFCINFPIIEYSYEKIVSSAQGIRKKQNFFPRRRESLDRHFLRGV